MMRWLRGISRSAKLRQASAYVRTATAGKQVPQIVSDWTTDVSLETRKTSFASTTT
jgi:hypothetical protein